MTDGYPSKMVEEYHLGGTPRKLWKFGTFTSKIRFKPYIPPFTKKYQENVWVKVIGFFTHRPKWREKNIES